MTTTSTPASTAPPPTPPTPRPVLVACPDARPPAYQAVDRPGRAGLLERFVTGVLLRGRRAVSELARQLVPCQFARLDGSLRAARPADPRGPGPLGLGSTWPWASRTAGRAEPGGAARGRPMADGAVRSAARRERRPRPPRRRPDLQRRGLGVRPARLPAAGHPDRPEHGPRRRPRRAGGPRTRGRRSPDFFPIYLGDGALDRDELAWLHERRLRDLELADRILVPSDHIADDPGRARDAPRADRGRPLRGRHPPVPPDPGEAARRDAAPSCSPAGSPSARGSSICSKPGAGPPARLEAPAPGSAAAHARPAGRLSA